MHKWQDFSMLRAVRNDREIWHAKCIKARRENWMRNLLRLLVLTACVAAAAPQSGKARPAAKVSLTGCVDERDGVYVLTNDTDLQPTARLKPAAGSPEDNFARHVGHKVKVRGVLSKEDTLPIMTVETVETVSETCAPSAGPQQP
jgi:hypothetical protein